ncbi:bifunctional diguanylate cyclase/phosphodiesterase [Massilia yuzhufengensis]|uniref:PAS domain S-box-containing protein/diguanylate cyclase (GGDEF) domain-containing protein n=1 Tax=Massilia yuzhufengensis TaxID=1164594 RepID=A0A1I1ERE7_9BURK|nr:EAL domain-containing protein [Massilia yuzhufengensis]SFB88068.1 PAS domain S-box-containing protein/diguanylate cyclase (GGDEF) domain-containing protein [Massilia yuzhufengensis]
MPRRLPLSLTLAAALTLGGGLAASGALFLGVSHLEYDNMALAFGQRTDERVAAVRQGIDQAVEVLTVTNQLFARGELVSREHFRDFTAALLQRHQYIQAFNFHRSVPGEARAAVEADLQRVRPGTVFTELRPDGLAPAPLRARYHIVDYIEPMAGNEAAFGLNITENLVVMSALETARGEGRAAATDLIQLAQDRDLQPAFELIMPVLDRQGMLAGDTAVIIRGPELVRASLAGSGLLDSRDIFVSVYAGERASRSALMFSTGDTRKPEDSWLAGFMSPGHTGYNSKVLRIAGKPWRVEVASAPRAFLQDHMASTALLVGGILMTLLGTAFVQASGQRARKVQQLVRQRTADLRRTNRRLVEDMAARERAERALQQSEQRFRQLVSMSSDWYWEQDRDLRFTMVTGGFTEKAGVSVESLLGKTRWEYVPALLDLDVGRAHVAQVKAHEPFANLEYQIRDEHGATRWFCVNGQPVFDDQGDLLGYRGTGSDITERKLTEQRVHHVAQHDVLTGLPNRSLLQDRLGQAIAYANRSARPMWVMLIDLDRFKFVNDSMGHKAGDVLLMTVAARLTASLRDTDTVARLSGDEFVVILSEHHDEPLSPDIVQRVMDSVAQPVMLGPKEFFVTCSIGVAVYPSEGTPADSLIEHADIAMYSAKKMGRNNFQFYTPAMNEESMERVRIESALRNALERNEFVLHYQPQVDLKTGQIVGMEALIRWQHPELGMVPPVRFIGIAEETGLIVQIGAWVMRTACAQNKAWQDAGLGKLRVAVNLSARQFGAPDLIAGLESVLADTMLDPDCLEIELTESLFMNDITPAVDLLHRMKSLGVNLSIDDFGTGYSSLSYLSRFPIDVLKIDRSFVADITVDANDAAIVTSIIALAHNLKLAVIAEGVETLEQLDYLRSHGCDEMQGYFFSKALPAAEFEQLLVQGRALPPPVLLEREPAPDSAPEALPA